MGLCLNGQKRWITNGGYASFYTVLATSDPKPERDLKARNRKIACFVVDRDQPWASRSAKKKTRWASAPATPPTCMFDDVRLPKEALHRPRGRGLQDCHEDL